MSSLVRPSLERMDQALQLLEGAVEAFQSSAYEEDAADTDGEELVAPARSSAKTDRDITGLVARKLDSAIDRLEALLAGE